MKILYVVPYAPNLIRVRPYNFIRTLRRQDHELTVATLWTDDGERADLRQLLAEGIGVIAYRLRPFRSLWNSLCSLPSSQPLQANFAWHPMLAAAIASELDRQPYDVIHVEHLRGARYGIHARKVLNGAGQVVPIVWDSVDSISHLFSQASRQSRSARGRLITRLELGRTKRSEERLPRHFDRVLVTSDIDRTAIADLSKEPELISRRIAVVPNGVDTRYFVPSTERSHVPTLVMSGKMSYHANVAMALRLLESIMPKVWQQCPDVRVWIVGKDPPPEIRSYGAAVDSESSEDTASAQVIVTGTVPDIRPYLQKATLAVAPIAYGAGIQNKVLEAMACATPVVASKRAIAAINAVDGQDVAVADDDDAFAEAIIRLLRSPETRRRMGINGRSFVERHHSWDAMTKQLVANYDIAGKNPGLMDASHPNRDQTSLFLPP